MWMSFNTRENKFKQLVYTLINPLSMMYVNENKLKEEIGNITKEVT